MGRITAAFIGYLYLICVRITLHLVSNPYNILDYGNISILGSVLIFYNGFVFQFALTWINQSQGYILDSSRECFTQLGYRKFINVENADTEQLQNYNNYENNQNQ